MADKYLYYDTTTQTKKEKAAIDTSAGAGDAGKIPALDSGGKLDTSMMPTGIGAELTTVVASENLADGDFVNLWNDSGTIKARKADATTDKRAHGFVLAAVTLGNNASVYRGGINNHVSGLTVGPQFLATTAGTATNTAPSSTGNIVQELGFANSSTEMDFNYNSPIILA